MRRIYESFRELAEVCTEGDAIFHGVIFNKHHTDPCYAWQDGVKQFASMLDQSCSFPKKGIELEKCIDVEDKESQLFKDAQRYRFIKKNKKYQGTYNGYNTFELAIDAALEKEKI